MYVYYDRPIICCFNSFSLKSDRCFAFNAASGSKVIKHSGVKISGFGYKM